MKKFLRWGVAAPFISPLLLGACATGEAPGSTLTTAPNSVVQYALDSLKSGEAVEWNHLSSGATGSIAPLRTFQITSGQYCRDFRVVYVSAEGNSDTWIETACREEVEWRRLQSGTV